jgi:hypothetical protein
MKHGKNGTLVTPELNYRGSFLKDKFHGEGILVDAMGRYEGNFESGVRQGQGVQ